MKKKCVKKYYECISLRQIWRFFNRPLIVAALSFLVLNIAYRHYSMIDTLKKTILYFPYAYTYSYRGATNERGNRSKEVLDNVPVVVNINEEKSFWFGITNKNYRSLKDVILVLVFPKGVEVKRWEEQGWIEYQPNEQYLYHFRTTIHNGMGQNTNPLTLKFSKKDSYVINYYISGEDIQRKDKSFIITVEK